MASTTIAAIHPTVPASRASTAAPSAMTKSVGTSTSLREYRSELKPATHAPGNRIAPPSARARPIVEAERPSSRPPISGTSVCETPPITKKTVNGVAAIAASSQREGAASAAAEQGGGSRSRDGASSPDPVTGAPSPLGGGLGEPGEATMDERRSEPAATATPTPAATPMAPRHPASAASAPPAAGPSVCPDISALENSAMFAPRRSAPAAVANAYMPVVLVSAEAQPISADATSACANEVAVANSAQATASEIPAPARPRRGDTDDAIRPAGKSVSKRPRPNAAGGRPRSPADNERAAPMSGSSGTRVNDATATANTTAPTRVRDRRTRCSSADSP